MKYTVKSGDTLSKISQAMYGDTKYYNLIAAENNISNPNLIYPGQVLTIPGTEKYGPLMPGEAPMVPPTSGSSGSYVPVSLPVSPDSTNTLEESKSVGGNKNYLIWIGLAALSFVFVLALAGGNKTKAEGSGNVQ